MASTVPGLKFVVDVRERGFFAEFPPVYRLVVKRFDTPAAS